jgi:hypothetical protein
MVLLHVYNTPAPLYQVCCCCPSCLWGLHPTPWDRSKPDEGKAGGPMTCELFQVAWWTKWDYQTYVQLGSGIQNLNISRSGPRINEFGKTKNNQTKSKGPPIPKICIPHGNLGNLSKAKYPPLHHVGNCDCVINRTQYLGVLSRRKT